MAFNSMRLKLTWAGNAIDAPPPALAMVMGSASPEVVLMGYLLACRACPAADMIGRTGRDRKRRSTRPPHSVIAGVAALSTRLCPQALLTRISLAAGSHAFVRLIIITPQFGQSAAALLRDKATLRWPGS